MITLSEKREKSLLILSQTVLSFNIYAISSEFSHDSTRILAGQIRYQYNKGITLIHHTASHSFRQLLIALFIFSAIAVQHSALAAEESGKQKSASIVTTISDDYSRFYASDRLVRMGIVFGAGAVMANTNIDMNIRNWYQDNVRDERTDSWSSDPAKDLTFNAKFFGEGKYMVPVALLAASVNYIDTDTAIGNWGAKTSRAYVTGLPAMWLMQAVTGASRPDETPEGSVWRPFNDGNGVSGHAFVGAVPFLTIAYINQDNNYIKYPAYLASMAAAWSRVNDDKHFPSQVVLGWYMAWEAVDTVFEKDKYNQDIAIKPMIGIDGFGLVAKGSW